MNKERKAPVLATSIQRINECNNWSELIDLFFEGEGFDIRRRNTDAPLDLYLNPVLCRLYDALHEEERARYLKDIVAQLKRYVMALSDASTVVEVGCGPGRILLGLASDPEVSVKGHKFIGYDPSPEMIAIADENLQGLKVESDISFFVGTTCHLTAKALLPKTDFLICRNVLSWLSDARREFGLWAELLPRGATIYVRDLRRDLPFEVAKQRLLECAAFKFHMRRLAYPPESMITAYMRAFTPAEVKSLFKDASLTFKEYPIDLCLPADGGRTSEAEMLFLAEPAS